MVEIGYTYKLGKESEKDRFGAIHPKTKALIERAAESANGSLPKGSRISEVQIYSGGQPAGTKIPGHSEKPRRPVIEAFGGGLGSVRHDYGGAADVHLYDEDGNWISYLTPHGKKALDTFARTAAQYGATGIGFGDEYMGQKTIHVGFGTEEIWGKMPADMQLEIVAGKKSRLPDAIVWDTNDEMTAQIIRLGFVDREGLPDIKAFQRSVGLAGDGELGEKTLTHIYFANRDVAGQPAPSLALNPDLAIRPLRRPILGPNFHHVDAKVMSSPYYTRDMLADTAAKVLPNSRASPTSMFAAPESYVLAHPARLAEPEKALSSPPRLPIPRARPNPLGAAIDFFKTGSGGIGPGAEKESVKAIQQFFAARGFTNDKDEAVTADGDFGASMEQALLKYQSQFPELAERGTVGPQTIVRMLRDNEGIDFMTRLPRRSDVPENIRRAAAEGERLAAYLMHPDKVHRDFYMARDSVPELSVPAGLEGAVEDYLSLHRDEVIELKKGRRSSGEMPPNPKPADQSWSSWLGDWFGWE